MDLAPHKHVRLAPMAPGLSSGSSQDAYVAVLRLARLESSGAEVFRNLPIDQRSVPSIA